MVFGAGAWAASVVWFAVLGFSAGRLQPFFATQLLGAFLIRWLPCDDGVAVRCAHHVPSVPTANVACLTTS